MAVSVLRGQINIYKQQQQQQQQRMEPYAEWYPSVEGYSDYNTQEGFAGPPLQAPPGYGAYDESLYPAETRKFYY